MKVSAGVSILLVVISLGCERHAADRAERVVNLPADIVVSKPAFATQRFIPTNSGDVAFDTKTGSLCKTWDWTLPDGQDYQKNVSRQMSTCDRLYTYDIQEEDRRLAETRQENANLAARQGEKIQTARSGPTRSEP